MWWHHPSAPCPQSPSVRWSQAKRNRLTPTSNLDGVTESGSASDLKPPRKGQCMWKWLARYQTSGKGKQGEPRTAPVYGLGRMSTPWSRDSIPGTAWHTPSEKETELRVRREQGSRGAQGQGCTLETFHGARGKETKDPTPYDTIYIYI